MLVITGGQQNFPEVVALASSAAGQWMSLLVGSSFGESNEDLRIEKKHVTMSMILNNCLALSNLFQV